MANPLFIFSIDLENFKTNHSNRSRMDGTFGQPLPSDDYWYTVKLEDGRGKRSF
jgi:gliding motility-associated-like protein